MACAVVEPLGELGYLFPTVAHRMHYVLSWLRPPVVISVISTTCDRFGLSSVKRKGNGTYIQQVRTGAIIYTYT